MSRHRVRRTPPLVLLPLLAALAGCQETTAPDTEIRPQRAQGDGGIWTVNSLLDPGTSAGCDDAECTLREAIAAASSGDVIEFAGGLDGSIELASQLGISLMTLSIDGDDRITLDGQGTTRVLASLSSELTLENLVIANGRASGASGGGIDAGGGHLTLDNVRFVGNQAQHGGALSLTNTDAVVRNGTFVENQASGQGGAISTVRSVLTIEGSTLEGNTAAAQGGAIMSGSGSELYVTASTIAGNTGDNGGGIYVLRDDGDELAMLERVTISGNLATGQFATGGVFNNGATTIRSSTVTRNGGSSVGGISNAGTMLVAGSIVAGNLGGQRDECGGANGIGSGGYNLHSGCDFNAATDIAVSGSQVFTEVLEQQLADNGGPTRTHALLPRGRAVDAGSCPAQTEDQRGFTRPVDDPAMPNANDGCDIGAYELQGTVAPVADLMISQGVDRTSVKQGELLTYTIRVQNLGPQAAPDVVVNDVLSSGVTFVSIGYDRGSHTAPPAGETGTVTWYPGELADQANETAEIRVTVLVRGKTTITSTATVAGAVVDPNEANNAAAITVSVAPGGSGGGKKR